MSTKINKNQNYLIDTQIIDLAINNNLITNFDESLLSGCSYDLRVGKIVKSRSRLTTINLDNKEFYAESGECFTIETLEEVNFRNNLLYGLIFNKHAILGKGLFHPATTVDPGFIGPLSITFFNLGNTQIKIEKGMKICSIHFQPLYPSPFLIYGTNQKPSYKEGDSQYTLNIDNPEVDQTDALLAKMYGAPISRLFEKIKDIERKFDLKLLTREDEFRKEERLKKSGLKSELIAALVGAIVSTVLTLFFTNDTNSSKVELENSRVEIPEHKNEFLDSLTKDKALNPKTTKHDTLNILKDKISR